MAVHAPALLTVAVVAVLAACSGQGPDTFKAPPTGSITTSPTVATSIAPAGTAEPTTEPWAWFRTFGGNRADLSICVDGVAGLSASDAEVELVREGLDSITSNLGVDGYLSYIVEAKTPRGCPEPPLVLGTAISRYEAVSFAYRVRAPSEHFVFVYFLPEEVYKATFGDEPYFEVGVEICCMTRNNATVTSSVYTTRSIDEGKLGEALMHAMAFRDYCAPGDVCPTRGPT